MILADPSLVSLSLVALAGGFLVGWLAGGRLGRAALGCVGLVILLQLVLTGTSVILYRWWAGLASVAATSAVPVLAAAGGFVLGLSARTTPPHH